MKTQVKKPTSASRRRKSAARRPISDQSKKPTLDNLTLSRKEGWLTYASAIRRVQPDQLTLSQLSDLGAKARADYDRQRRIWHANMPTIKTSQFLEIHETLWDIVDSNMQDGDKVKGAVGLEGLAGIGKSVCVQEFLRDFHNREIEELGHFTDAGHERWPVCRVGMTGNTGMKEFNRALLRFFNHAGTKKGTTAEFADRALDCVLSCQTRLLVVDDLHFLRLRTTSTEISNQFKYISNEFPLTIIFIGIGLSQRGLYSDGTYADGLLGQSGRRTTALTMSKFGIDESWERAQWRRLLLAVEKRITLADAHRGMLVEELSDYLYARSSGRIGSLMTLVNRGCLRAIRTGAEHLDRELLDRVPNDAASEHERTDLQTSFDSGRRTTKTTRRLPRADGCRAA